MEQSIEGYETGSFNYCVMGRSDHLVTKGGNNSLTIIKGTVDVTNENNINDK